MAIRKERIVSATLRRILYVLSYELLAITLTILGLWLLGYSGSHSGTVALVSSGVALIWNYIFNLIFEAWERKQVSQKRTIGRRIVHALGFEGGLVVILVPLLAWILQVGLLQALVLEAGLLIFFLIYTFVFSWGFDKLVPAARYKQPQPA